MPGELRDRGKGWTQPFRARINSDRPGGKCAAKVSVRSAIAGRPERESPTAPPLVFSSCAAVVLKRQEPMDYSNHSVGKRSELPAPQVRSWGRGVRDAVLGLAATSSIQSVGQGSAWDGETV